jgi:hypothetical protein
MLPLATPLAARHIMAVTPTAMIAAWPMLRKDRVVWFLSLRGGPLEQLARCSGGFRRPRC